MLMYARMYAQMDTLAVGVFLGGHVHCAIRISTEIIKSFLLLAQMVSHDCVKNPPQGPKTRVFLEHHSGTASLSVSPLRKLK